MQDADNGNIIFKMFSELCFVYARVDGMITSYPMSTHHDGIKSLRTGSLIFVLKNYLGVTDFEL